MKKKTNTLLAEAIFIAKKNNLTDIAKALSISTRKQAKVNLEQIENAKEDIIFIPGKVLGAGEISKKKTIYAIGFSTTAKEKLKKSGCEIQTIFKALEKNNKLKVAILK